MPRKKQSEEERKKQKRVAERDRMAKIKNNPELYALWKEKQKERYIKMKRQGTIVPIREMTPKQQKLARIKSRASSARWYYKNKLKRKSAPRQSEVEDIEDDNTEAAEEDVQKFEPEESCQEMAVPTSMIEITNNIPRQYSLEEHSKRQLGIQDEYDAIGINVAAKLRGLPQSTRILAEKLINDVLFQAQANGLRPSTFISTPDPFKQDLM